MSSTPANSVDSVVSEVLERHRRDPTRLVQILRDIQGRYAHIPVKAMEQVAEKLGVQIGRVRGAVDFYSFLHTSPRGGYDILLSDSITDQMLGKGDLMEQLCQRLRVEPDETRADGRVTVASTSCTGMCDQGPAGLVNGYAITNLTRERIDAIAELVEAGKPLEQWPRDYFEVRDHIHRADVLLESEGDDDAALRAVTERGPDVILDEILASGLRGLGGAGFKTGIKWGFCRDASPAERYVVCNADEGEPGTFKDRVLLQSYADRVFEGMTVCARIVGAERGFLYLRGEYLYLLQSLEATLQRRRQDGLLGENIAGENGFSFDIEIHLGAGAYICGEESALIESLEGKRGVARIRPPFPVTHGFFNKPTVVNNVETFMAAGLIAARGGDWFAGIGTADSKGTKLISVSGDCARRGIYEYPYGVTLQQVVEDCGAENVQAVQVAGAAGHCFPASELDRRIAFEGVATGGSFMVFNRDRDMLDVTRNFVHFFAHESCGFCTPCRVGTSLMKNLVDKVWSGHGTRTDLEEMRNLGSVMRHTSQCGLGATAPNTVFDSLDKFPDVYERRLKSMDFEPAFDLDGALEAARELTGRDDDGAHL